MIADSYQRFRSLGRNARLYLLSNTMQAASAGALGVLYTLYLSALGYQPSFIGALVVLGTIGGALGIIPANPLVRRFGWRTMLLWSDMIGGFSVALQLLFPTPPIMILTTIGIGASVAIIFVINTPLLTAYSTPRERTALFGINNALNILATIAGSLLGGFLPTWFEQASVRSSTLLVTLSPVLVPDQHQARAYQLSLLVTGIIAIPAFIPVLLMRDERHAPPPSPNGDETTNPAAGTVLSPAAALTANPVAATDPSQMLPWRKWLIVQWPTVRTIAIGIIGRFSLTQALNGFGAGLWFPYVSLYFVNYLHTTSGYFGALSAALSLAAALASLLAAPLADRYGKVRTSIVVQFCSIPCLLAIGGIPLVAVASAAYLLRGFFMTITGPPLQTFLMESVPEERRVVASSVYNVAFQVAWALGAGLGGIIASVSLRLPFIAAAPFYLISALLMTAWFATKHR
ncbi:MAG: MFS transporter [Ktedonobacterales bacterium]